MKETSKVVLITGAARRIGAAIAELLHQQGMRVVIHYRHSAQQATALCQKLNAERPDSALALQADLLNCQALPQLINDIIEHWGQLDVIVNNASSFYPSKIGEVTETQWDDLLGSNLKAPFFLAQAAQSYLAKNAGCIVNITDVHAAKPLKFYSVYSIAKAGLVMLTQSLAKELGPKIRVNAVAPGCILWPEGANDLDETRKQNIMEQTLLKRQGDTDAIAKAVLFLIEDAHYTTGHVLSVAGGRSLS